MHWLLDCRLVDFSVTDSSGQQQPLETHGVRETELFLSGRIAEQCCNQTCPV